MESAQPLRPRWGTFSVIDHQRPAALIPEILLYDRLVFPVPTDDADRQRWTDRGWKPELLDSRLKELEGLVHATPWSPELRKEWGARWERMKKLGRDTEAIAMGITPMVLAMSVYGDHIPPPVMIAAYQDPVLAKADLALNEESDTRADPRGELDWAVRALFERRLDMPVAMHPHRTYEKAIALAHDAEFQRARRSLFEWEDQIVAAGWPTPAAAKKLEELVDAHDDFIRTSFAQTVKRSVFRVVEFATGSIVSYATANPLVGLAAGGAVKLVGARLPMMKAEAGDPVAQPSAALHKAISVMFHDV